MYFHYTCGGGTHSSYRSANEWCRHNLRRVLNLMEKGTRQLMWLPNVVDTFIRLNGPRSPCLLLLVLLRLLLHLVQSRVRGCVVKYNMQAKQTIVVWFTALCAGMCVRCTGGRLMVMPTAKFHLRRIGLKLNLRISWNCLAHNVTRSHSRRGIRRAMYKINI